MHPRDMFLAEKGATDLNSTDQEFALSWYRRGVESAKLEAYADVIKFLESNTKTWGAVWRLENELLRRGIKLKEDDANWPDNQIRGQELKAG